MRRTIDALRARVLKARHIKKDELTSRRLHRLSLSEAHQRIHEAITKSGDLSFLVGRSGTTEAKIIYEFVGRALAGTVVEGLSHNLDQKIISEAKFSSGVVMNSSLETLQFVSKYLAAITSCDVYAHSDYVRFGTGIAKFLEQSDVPLVDIGDLEPLNALRAGVTPWSHALEGKRVLVVHPFEESIRRGYETRARINGVRELLPEFADLVTLRPPVTFLNTEAVTSWDWSLGVLTSKMAHIDYEVAIFGAGGYGLPAAAFAKATGKTAVHLGGATQLLFGIRGLRWLDHKKIGPWMDDSWISPTLAERPPGYEHFEGGKGYW